MDFSHRDKFEYGTYSGANYINSNSRFDTLEEVIERIQDLMSDQQRAADIIANRRLALKQMIKKHNKKSPIKIKIKVS